MNSKSSSDKSIKIKRSINSKDKDSMIVNKKFSPPYNSAIEDLLNQLIEIMKIKTTQESKFKASAYSNALSKLKNYSMTLQALCN